MNRANQATPHLEISLRKDLLRAFSTRELKFWWKRNYGFFAIKRIHQWHAECCLPLLKVKRELTHLLVLIVLLSNITIWLFIMIVLQREFSEGRVSDFSSAFWRIIPTNQTFLSPRQMQRNKLISSIPALRKECMETTVINFVLKLKLLTISCYIIDSILYATTFVQTQSTCKWQPTFGRDERRETADHI